MTNVALPPLTAVIHEEELSDGSPVWVARCPELEVTSQGFSPEDAQQMLREAVELFLEVADDAEIARRLKKGARVVALDVKLAA